MPQWAGSCWYYLRFIDPHNPGRLVDPELERYWMPVDLYIGGAEHAVLHLLYARFWHKVLYDAGLVSCDEPFRKVVHQGVILRRARIHRLQGRRRRAGIGRPRPPRKRLATGGLCREGYRRGP